MDIDSRQEKQNTLAGGIQLEHETSPALAETYDTAIGNQFLSETQLVFAHRNPPLIVSSAGNRKESD